MKKPILITSALPYANGPLHIGHMVEYVQTDIFSRYMKLKGEKAVYCCADDTHGTPIEVNAAKVGKTPEEFIAHWFKKHVEEMKAYLIEHDSYYTTNSKESRHFTELIFNKLKDNGYIYKKEIELMYCDHDKRFLPDRFVKGICPKCGAKDQYGDSCEKCGSTYTPVDLIEGYCTLCKNPPLRKQSEHYFFKLSSFSVQLKDYLSKNKSLQPEIVKQILHWVDDGLDDWCISRDAPYFGFKIPGEEKKYFYVWLDAPIGYIASLANYFKGDVAAAEKTWNDSEIIHFIGKDIIYFHLLFWPAVLMGAGMAPPSNVVVHGFLNINKEKMSKSRGTFFTANEMRMAVKPEYLRYYIAGNLTHSMTDIDLDVDNLKAKINNELVSNIANFVYRTLSFTNKNFGSKLSKIRDKMLIEDCLKKAKEAGLSYKNFDFREAVRLILEIGSMGNRYFQENAPWELIKIHRDETLLVLTDCANIAKILSIVAKPILPEFSKNIEEQLGLKPQSWNDLDKMVENRKIGEAKIVFTKVDEIRLPDTKIKKPEPECSEDPFSKLNLKVAKITSVSEHFKADKLLIINIDLGKETRQLVAGLRPYYEDPQVLVGKNIIVVANLAHANLRGETSQGMLLAAETDDAKTVMALEAPESNPGDQVHADGISIGKETINFDDFMKVGIYVSGGKVLYKGKQLQTDKEKIVAKIEKGKVR